jgi:hypothetical protein
MQRMTPEQIEKELSQLDWLQQEAYAQYKKSEKYGLMAVEYAEKAKTHYGRFCKTLSFATKQLNKLKEQADGQNSG